MTMAVVFILLCLGAAIALAMWRAPLWAWAVLVAVITLAIQTGLAFGPMGGLSFTKVLAWLPAIILAVIAYRPIRRQYVIAPAFRMVKKILPPVSATEREALEAGTVGFDAEIFGGEPDWEKLRAVRPLTLTPEERAFLDGPVEELCRMVDDWQIRAKGREVPKEIWDFVKKHGFLGMLISKEHGGLGFSAQALARAGRTDREIRHRRAEGALPAAPRQGRGRALLCPHRAVRRVGCGLHARYRHGGARPA
jgi:acyl-CoA dehydrogenase